MGSNPSFFYGYGDGCPVEMVSWDDIQQFIQRLNQLTGKRFRLPTEDEWHTACVSGSRESEYCGGDDVDAVAWYRSNSGNVTHRVGQKQPNSWGLYDMSGNVWEWTDTSDKSDFRKKLSCGGSWGGGLNYVRPTDRVSGESTNRSHGLGFRLARDT